MRITIEVSEERVRLKAAELGIVDGTTEQVAHAIATAAFDPVQYGPRPLPPDLAREMLRARIVKSTGCRDEVQLNRLIDQRIANQNQQVTNENHD